MDNFLTDTGVPKGHPFFNVYLGLDKEDYIITPTGANLAKRTRASYMYSVSDRHER